MNFVQFGVDLIVIARFVGEGAIRAAFDSIRVARVFKITAALIAQKIERAIAKQAVESHGIAMLMAREIPALDVSEKLMAVVHTSPFYKNSIFQEYPDVFPENPVYN